MECRRAEHYTVTQGARQSRFVPLSSISFWFGGACAAHILHICSYWRCLDFVEGGVLFLRALTLHPLRLQAVAVLSGFKK